MTFIAQNKRLLREWEGEAPAEPPLAENRARQEPRAPGRPPGLNVVRILHGGLVHKRRVRVLSRLLAALIPDKASVLDVGCGDGLIDHLIQSERPDVKIEGIDVKVRPGAHIPVTAFDGRVIPHGTQSFDIVMFVDVLHHMTDPMILLREAVRVARKAVVIKDHLGDTRLDRWILRGKGVSLELRNSKRSPLYLPKNTACKA